jgi:hypothetical protein
MKQMDTITPIRPPINGNFKPQQYSVEPPPKFKDCGFIGACPPIRIVAPIAPVDPVYPVQAFVINCKPDNGESAAGAGDEIDPDEPQPTWVDTALLLLVIVGVFAIASFLIYLSAVGFYRTFIV